jgi:hypothetical protein
MSNRQGSEYSFAGLQERGSKEDHAFARDIHRLELTEDPHTMNL